MRPSSQLPIETHAAIYCVSLIIIFKLVGALFANLPSLFNKKLYQCFIVFVAGLCTRDKNQSAHGIAQFFGLNSHDALTRMLSHKSWSAGLLMLELLNQAIQISTGSTSQSWLILDDVILPKPRSQNTEGVFWDWDYVHNKHVLCMRLVVLVWSNGIIRIPVAFALYYKKNCDYLLKYQRRFRTKNQLARALVCYVTKKGLNFDYLLFDSWYANADNFKLFNKLNITFVTALKSNRKLGLPFYPLENKPKRKGKYPRWYQMTCSGWAAQKSYVRDYRYYKKVSARARQQSVFIEDVNSFMKMVCIKNYAKNNAFKKMITKADKQAKDPNKYLLTNDANLYIWQIIALYRKRWAIEVMFRDCKQLFALGKCQAHKFIEPHLRHTAIVFFTFSLIELTKSKDNPKLQIGTTCGQVKRYLQNQQLIYFNGQYQLVDVSKTDLNWDKVNYIAKVLDLNSVNCTETQLVLNLIC